MKQDFCEPMRRRVTTLSDGRYLIFFEFNRKDFPTVDRINAKVERESTPSPEENEENSV